MLARLKRWWASFDRAGRRMMDSAFPILVSDEDEKEYLAEARRKQEAMKDRPNG